jgi:hypothetical protein
MVRRGRGQRGRRGRKTDGTRTDRRTGMEYDTNSSRNFNICLSIGHNLIGTLYKTLKFPVTESFLFENINNREDLPRNR